MKKTKLLMPILGVGAIAATVAPMVAITGCNKEEAEEFTIVQGKNLTTPDGTNVNFGLKWSKHQEGMQFEFQINGTFKTKDGDTYDVSGSGTFKPDSDKAGSHVIITGGQKSLSKGDTIQGSFLITYEGEDAPTIKTKIKGITITYTAD